MAIALIVKNDIQSKNSLLAYINIEVMTGIVLAYPYHALLLRE